MDQYKNEPKYHIIRESAHMYDSRPFSGYTIEDYYALPDEQRVELINGVFYDMASPTVRHQSKRRDYVIKAGKYCEAGVREYWIIDPDMERVIVYDFESDAAPIIYSMVDEVPVRIFDGELTICFPEDESIV